MPSAHCDSNGSSGSGLQTPDFDGVHDFDDVGSLWEHKSTDCGQPMLMPFQIYHNTTLSNFNSIQKLPTNTTFTFTRRYNYNSMFGTCIIIIDGKACPSIYSFIFRNSNKSLKLQYYIFWNFSLLVRLTFSFRAVFIIRMYVLQSYEFILNGWARTFNLHYNFSFFLYFFERQLLSSI